MIDLDAAEGFILREARLLERLRFVHLFRGAGAEPVLTALDAYRNGPGAWAILRLAGLRDLQLPFARRTK